MTNCNTFVATNLSLRVVRNSINYDDGIACTVMKELSMCMRMLVARKTGVHVIVNSSRGRTGGGKWD